MRVIWPFLIYLFFKISFCGELDFEASLGFLLTIRPKERVFFSNFKKYFGIQTHDHLPILFPLTFSISDPFKCRTQLGEKKFHYCWSKISKNTSGQIDQVKRTIVACRLWCSGKVTYKLSWNPREDKERERERESVRAASNLAL